MRMRDARRVAIADASRVERYCLFCQVLVSASQTWHKKAARENRPIGTSENDPASSPSAFCGFNINYRHNPSPRCCFKHCHTNCDCCCHIGKVTPCWCCYLIPQPPNSRAPSELSHSTPVLNMIPRPLSHALRSRCLLRKPQSIQGFSTRSNMRAADHGDHYDPPTGWLFGIKPGHKYVKEGWESLFYYGFIGSLLAAGVAYVFKPDTSYVSASVFPTSVVSPTRLGLTFRTSFLIDMLTLVTVYKPGLWRRLVGDWRPRASWRTPRWSRNKRLDSRPILYTVHREIGDYFG